MYSRSKTLLQILNLFLFASFCEHIRSQLPKDILSLDEFLRLRQEVVSSKPEVAIPEAAVDSEAPPGAEEEAPSGDEDEAPPGEEAPPGITEAAKV